MAYEWEEIRTSQEIFYYLLEHHELREDEELQMYQAYTQREAVQNLVKSQGEAAGSMIERYGDVIYLIPREENNFLGYSKVQLKAALCKSGASDKDFYLSQFVILILLVEFYDGQGSSSKSRNYIRVGELQNSISQRLKDGAGGEEDEEATSTTRVMGQLRVVDFEDYDQLHKEDYGVYSTNQAARDVEQPNILWKMLERSNVDMVEEMTSMMTAQRALQSAAQVLKMYDQIMSKAATEVGRL